MEMSDVALGKQPHEANLKTLQFGDFLTVPSYPTIYNFDSGRKPFPLEMWGNNAYGDCVMVSQYNQLVRLERVELRGTIKVTTADVLDAYADESERQFGHRPEKPGDENDQGLVMQYSLRDWRKFGVTTALKKDPWKITAFGEVNKNSPSELRSACYALRGVLFGFSLPISAYYQLNGGQPWDVTSGPNAERGSWGGHAVYAPAYDSGGFTCLTWGAKQRITNAFISRYADEAWAVVDAVDAGGTGRWLNVEAMMQKLKDISASGIE